MERRLIHYDTHPDTNAQINGKIIPNWKQIKEEIINCTNKLPYLNFIAWDVALTEDGIRILEANASSDATLFQIHKGVKNEELGQIYKEYNIIK